MIFLDEKDKSILQKTLIIVCLSSAFAIVAFTNKYPVHLHQILLPVCALTYILRLGLTLFVFLQRRLVWLETLTIAVIMSIILFILAYTGDPAPRPFTINDILGVVLYISGSFINTYSEYSRFDWKSKPENKGHIYRYGLFKYSMHINYFGDVLLFLGFSILSGRYWTMVIPTGMLLNFMIFIIRSLDSYLSEKYGDEFLDYSRNTKKLIPFVY